MKQARAILWAQWRTVRNSYPRAGIGWTAVIGFVWYGFWLVAAVAAARVVAPALMVMAIILFMGTVSGAHLNPVVSAAFALRGDFPWRRVPAYVVAQFIGGVLATDNAVIPYAVGVDIACRMKLTVYDRKTHYVLWAFTESIEIAYLQKTHDRNFDDALNAVLLEFESLSGKAQTVTH